jgi:hypothetical protein
MIRNLAFMSLKVLLLGCTLSTYAASDLVWYEPTNLGNAGGNAPDFGNLFTPGTDAQWAGSRRVTDVIMLRYSTLRNFESKSPGFINHTLVPFLRRNNLKLAIDSTVATWLSCRTETDQKSLLSSEVTFLKSLSAAGVRIAFISMQSTLSKNPVDNRCYYPVQVRIKDIAIYIKTIRTFLPQLATTEIGLIDASLAKGNTWVKKNLEVNNIEALFDRLLTALQGQGLKLSYIHLDQPWETISDFNPSAPSSFADIVRLQRYLKNKQLKAGLLLTTTNGSSDHLFHTRVQQVARSFVKSNAVGRHFILSSWSAYPRNELPEKPTNPSQIPLTKVLLDVGTYLKRQY